MKVGEYCKRAVVAIAASADAADAAKLMREEHVGFLVVYHRPDVRHRWFHQERAAAGVAGTDGLNGDPYPDRRVGPARASVASDDRPCRARTRTPPA
jgi:hypothetical protein